MNAPFSPAMPVTCAPWRMFTLNLASCSSQRPRIVSREPASNVNVRAQWQDRRLRHHELALLVFEDRVGRMLLGFEQDVRGADVRRAAGRRQAGRAAADDGDLERFSHRSAAPAAGRSGPSKSGRARGNSATLPGTAPGDSVRRRRPPTAIRRSPELMPAADLSAPFWYMKLATLPMAIVACSAPA